MVFRLTSPTVNTTAVNFDGGSITRAGQRASGDVGEAVKALENFKQDEAALFHETSMTDFSIGLKNDLRGIASGSLGGENFSTLANESYEARKSALYDQAGENEYKRELLDNYFDANDTRLKDGFADQELDLNIERSLFMYKQNVDNAMQEVTGQQLVPPSESNHSPRSQPSVGSPQSAGHHRTGWNGVSQSARTTLAQLENIAGRTFNITSAYRDPKHNDDVGGAKQSQHMHGNAFDVDVSDLSTAERQELIRQARQAGFGGVGVYSNSLHFDVGATRAWGANFSSSSIPNWAKGALGATRGGSQASENSSTHDQYNVPVFNGDLPNLWDNSEIRYHRDEAHAAVDVIPGLTANRRAELKAQADSDLMRASFGTIANQNGPMAMAMLRSGEYNDYLTYGQDQAFQRNIMADMERDVARQEQERMAVVRQEATGIAQDQIAFQMSDHSAEQPAMLNDEQYMSLTSAQRRSYDQAQQMGGIVAEAHTIDLGQAEAFLSSIEPSGDGFAFEQEAYGVVEPIIRQRQQVQAVNAQVGFDRENGIPQDMSNPLIKDEVDRRFEETVFGSDNPYAAAIQFSDEYRVLPDQFKTMIARGLGADDPAMQQAAVEAVVRLNAINPNALANGGSAIKRAIEINSWVESGLSLKKAVDLSNQLLDPAGATHRQSRLDYYRGNMREAAQELFLDRLKSRGEQYDLSGREAEAAIPVEVWDEYERLVEAEYQTTGNIDVAVAAAELAFRTSHGLTSIGGIDRWARGAPEALPEYQGMDYDTVSSVIETQGITYAQDQLGDEVEQVFITIEGDGRRIENPSYSVTAQKSDGTVEIVRGFRPDRDEVVAAHAPLFAEREKASEIAGIEVQIASAERDARLFLDDNLGSEWTDDQRDEYDRLDAELRDLRSQRRNLSQSLSLDRKERMNLPSFGQLSAAPTYGLNNE